ncbi:MAG: 2-hydroxycarboxylate transporter family protein [Candidatus Phytoplasma australasiaticum]|nr:2-hydroxycarboxylate transporter family protein [Candidatus Phytoplasma australasiaticum]
MAAGLCANSIGGAGNLAILEASDSLELSPQFPYTPYVMITH